ncbi:MBL fold metallo-hydrolase [Chitinophaga pendula]|uniref:MBL fold metallo-hydrolase n=1 Tax=Chitinophaga TaxID=79328 RepID=UPI0018E02909|nr:MULTISPECIES: MBL fold metallo-hydrolase [Chitinophaga]UCJ08918.1 MBL fold metallo-hydrolase [Chitinophaga pendula]
MNYIQNSELQTIKPGWPGTPLTADGRFVNHEFPFIPRLWDVLKWKWGPQPQKLEKQQDTFRLQTYTDTRFLQQEEDCIVWLGHASFYIRIAGIRMLIDPIFFKVPFVKRYTPPPFPAEVFKDLDYLLISHDHQDHCQKKSVRAVISGNPAITVLTGLRMETLLRQWIGNTKLQTAGWYQQYHTPAPLQIYFLPSRHWSRRGLNDTNKRLWGAFVLKSENKTIYFSGDTGYGDHFKTAHILFPHIDVAIIGAGAYKPEWFMSPAHISPANAVIAANELMAKVLIPMHYGTLDLSDEPVGEPLRELQRMQQEGLLHGSLHALQSGEVYTGW